MKAVVYTHYGPTDVLQIKEINMPVPNHDEVLIKIHATTVNRTDNATIKGIPFFARIITGLFKPKKQTPGTELAGVVVTVGDKVTAFKPGDRVFGFNDTGTQSQAEYTSVKQQFLASMPEGNNFEEMAPSMEGAHYAQNFINKITIEKDQEILVNGATGGIGSAAVQLLRTYDVTITAVCSEKNIDLVKGLGADRIIAYEITDFTHDNQQYDYVFDTVGKSSFFKCQNILKPGGIYISSDLGYLAQNLFLPSIAPVLKLLFNKKHTRFPNPADIPGSIQLVKNLIEQGKVKADIDRTYPLNEIINAYKYVEQGHKLGNVVIKVVE